MRVTAVNMVRAGDVPGACEIYRANMPLYHLATRGGHGVSWLFFDEIVKAYRERGQRVLLDFIDSSDVFIFPRTTVQEEAHLEPLAALVELMRLTGKRTVYEVDDDLSNQHRDFSGRGLRFAMQIASWMDAITVTTPHLADLMKLETGRPVYVLPNMLDPMVWKRPEYAIPHDGVTIGLSGSATHAADWQVLETVMRSILETQYDMPVQFIVTGFHPPYLADLPNTQYLPGVVYEEYAEIVRGCDIILAPLDPHDGFNHSKSPIKIIEGMGATRLLNGKPVGAACVATDTPVYRLASNRFNCALIEQTPEAWYTALHTLLTNHNQRHELQKRGHNWVWKNHDVSQTWRMWETAYAAILKRPAHSLLPLSGLSPAA